MYRRAWLCSLIILAAWVSSEIIEEEYHEKPAQVTVIGSYGRFRFAQVRQVTNSTDSKCPSKAMCPYPNGVCCAPTYLVCCKYGCIQGNKGVRCQKPPPSPEQAKWDAEQMKLAEDDYKDKITEMGLQAQAAAKAKEFQDKKEKLRAETKKVEQMARELAAANRAANKKAEMQRQMTKKIGEAKAQEQARKQDKTDIELAPRVKTRKTGSITFHKPQFKVVDDFCHIQGTLERFPDIQSILGNLAEKCRPQARLVNNALVGQAETIRLDILDNGVITFVGGQGLSSWASLDGMTLYTKGQPDSIELPSPWVQYNRGFADPSYKFVPHKDAALCFLFGLARIDNWAMSSWVDHLGTIPRECRPDKKLTFLINQHENSLRVEVHPTGMVMYTGGMKAHAWISFDGIRYLTKMNQTLELVGDWKPFPCRGCRAPSWAKVTQVCVLSGMVVGKGGTGSRTIAVVPRACQPSATLVFSVASKNSQSILYLHPDGKLVWQKYISKTFPALWISLDGIKYIAP